MNWTLDLETFIKPKLNHHGFVYEIGFQDGKKYIGKKNFFTVRKRKFGKKELAKITDKRLKKYEIVVKESDWKDYNSSNAEVLERINNGDLHYKKILYIACCKKELTYMEEYFLYKTHAIGKDCYYNNNIGGTYFTKDYKEWERINV